GLGVDALYLSKSFERVVTIECNEILAAIVRENFKRMGVSNVEVVTGTAEEYIARCQERFDWLYVDPDRRVEGERRVVCLEGCSPNIVELMPRAKEIAPRVGIKCSPLFDVDEAFRIFGDVRVEVVSLLDECKEVMIYTGAPRAELAATGVGRFEFSAPRAEVDNTPYSGEFNPAKYRYLMVVDVALQKSRLACHATRPFARMWSGNGFAFLSEATELRYGRLLEIERIVEYHPRQLKREFKGTGAEIIMRDFAPSLTQVREKLGLKSGAQWRLALTTINGVQYLIVLK
ncbi:MAG: SAM-dependent methyltransferase, partial [Rikenellaceae bacterium]